MTTRSQSINTAGIENVSTSATHNRWLQLGLALVCMMAISSPQYVWTLMTKPLAAKLGIALPELQVTFSLLVILQTFFSPFQGKLIDRFGPRTLISIGTVMSGLSWVLASQVQSALMLYLTYGVVGGLGTGIVYVGVDNLMVARGRDVRAWIAFAFGFIHGFGFANVLREMNLPSQALGWSLFSFNLGVEIGQLLVVVLVASALAALRSSNETASRRLAFAGSLAVILVGAFWFVQRVFFPGGIA